MSSNDEKKPVSRRNFLKGAGIGVAAASSAGFLAGCGPQAAESTPEPEEAAGAAPAAAAECTDTPAYLTPPEPIAPDDVAETISADVVVVGAGLAGLSAALKAQQDGASTVLIEKQPTFTFHGHHCGVIGSKVHKEMGIEIDKNEVVNTLMNWAGNKPEQRLIRLWADRSGEAADWAIDMAEARGVEVGLDLGLVSDDPLDTNKQFPTPLTFDNWANNLTPTLEENAKNEGVDVRYNTPAVQLLREEGGRVTGVIAQNAEGEYIQIDAAKGVVLCTGDFGSNQNMIEHLCPWALDATENWYGNWNTGDGHQMALWVGAAMDDMPNCTMMHPSAGIVGYDRSEVSVPMYASALLDVNTKGERYVNEEQLLPYIVSPRLQQPDSVSWQVFDGNWEEYATKMGSGFGRLAEVTDTEREQIAAAVEAGALLQADTVEELAEKMDVPPETLKATIDRYNELAAKGEDEDFGKRADRLFALEQPPFYAVKRGSALLVTLGGLKVNPGLEVLDANSEPIPGLYAAGNTSGRFFANDYPMAVSGLSHGRALTFGYLAGGNAAAS